MIKCTSLLTLLDPSITLLYQVVKGRTFSYINFKTWWIHITKNYWGMSIFLLTSSIQKMEPSDWLNTKIGRTHERFKIGSWFWARWKALLFLFPTVYDTYTQKYFLIFRKFGHVTDDDIILTCVQNFGKMLWPKCCLIHFRKSHGGLVRQYIRFLSIIRKFSRGAY